EPVGAALFAALPVAQADEPFFHASFLDVLVARLGDVAGFPLGHGLAALAGFDFVDRHALGAAHDALADFRNALTAERVIGLGLALDPVTRALGLVRLGHAFGDLNGARTWIRRTNFCLLALLVTGRFFTSLNWLIGPRG